MPMATLSVARGCSICLPGLVRSALRRCRGGRLSHYSSTKGSRRVGSSAPMWKPWGSAGSRIFRRDATRLGPVHPLKPFSLAFADPPYHQGLGERALLSARDGGWLTPGAIVVVEEGIGRVTPPDGFDEIERRGYDDSELVFLKTRP